MCLSLKNSFSGLIFSLIQTENETSFKLMHYKLILYFAVHLKIKLGLNSSKSWFKRKNKVTLF